jgi:isoleucyl-tRNA synthetase
LHECLLTLATLLAPFCPFVADELHRNLAPDAAAGRTVDSVHLADWPVADPSALDEALEREMDAARTVVSLGLSARNEAKLKVRQPLRRALVLLPDAARFSDAVAAEVADALNVKVLDPVADLEGLLDYTVVPNFRALGPRAGKQVPLVKAALAAVDGATVRGALEGAGAYDLVLADGSTLRLGPDDIAVRATSHEELALAREGSFAVAIDTLLDNELRAEGTARDLIRLVNDQRKAAGLQIADRIRLQLGADARHAAAAHLHRDWIAREVLAVEFTIVAPDMHGGAATFELDGDAVTVSVIRA